MASGPYPKYVKQSSGRVIPVVLAYCCSKYLGSLELNFDSDGNLKLPVDGVGVTKANPILLDSKIQMDENMLHIVDKYKRILMNHTK